MLNNQKLVGTHANFHKTSIFTVFCHNFNEHAPPHGVPPSQLIDDLPNGHICFGHRVAG